MGENTKWELMLSLRFGPIWDGNLNSKSARDDLVDAGLVERGHGFQWLSLEGIRVMTVLGFLHEETWKESRETKGTGD